MGTDYRLVCLMALLMCVQPDECTEIIGGKEVRPHSLPYMALLENAKGAPFCGGTLIDLRWVLTAAHCTNVKKVLLGVHSLSKPEKVYRQTRKVAHKFPHPCYDADSKTNDLMLLKLDRKAKTTGAVHPLPLPSPTQDIPAGVACTIAGWGYTKNGGKMSDTLLRANVTVIGRDVCNSKDYYNLNPVITRDMLCAGFVDKTPVDTCSGDSGGPLVCQGVIRGVTSFGAACGMKKKPGVYAALSKKHTEWIHKKIKI
ncbi:hypothetical protein AAFF_G00065000 [Aldrovandia affinis]|uniref:Peptidase S1 domain-containing protein n=1 Tax=Aldrovandia affinis TaxID=143900 RepID=A0AAD7T532_9TELE|nr:hypothetical protein AAFF_G00065000 [Aldrovandia affinis]